MSSKPVNKFATVGKYSSAIANILGGILLYNFLKFIGNWKH